MQSMRKELTAVSAFSMVISFVAAIVLCVHLALMGPLLSWEPSGPIVWVFEVSVFGTAIYLWRRSASLGGWMVGIGALALARVGLTMFCALALSKYQPGLTFDNASVQLAPLGPRLCAIFFALMICYPLRGYLPTTLLRRGSPLPKPTEGPPEASPVWMMDNPQRPAKHVARKVEEVVPIAHVVPGRFGGSVDVPLRGIVSRIPKELLTQDARQYAGDLPVSIPLFLIGPQLKEAKIDVRLADLRDLLPPHVLVQSAPTGSEGEPVVVSLALEDVIPALPPEVLELPPPSPPAWAAYPDPDGVVLANA